MRCKPDVASPTGCRAASCRFLSFSVVFLPFRPAFPAVRSSCLPRRPLLLSSPPSPLPFFRAPSRSGSLYYIIVRPSGNGAVPCSVLRLARASSLSRLFPLAPCPCPFRAPFPPPRNIFFCYRTNVPPTPCPCPFRVPFPPPRYIFFCYRTNGIRNISVNLSRKNPQSNRFQLKYLKINSYDFD